MAARPRDRRTPRRLALYVVAVAAVASCSSMSAKTSTGDAVSAKNFAFSPSKLAVKAGATVVFTNNDTTTHTFTASDGSFDAGRKAPGESFSFTVPSSAKSGTVIKYHCSIHHSMSGELDVS